MSLFRVVATCSGDLFRVVATCSALVMKFSLETVGSLTTSASIVFRCIREMFDLAGDVSKNRILMDLYFYTLMYLFCCLSKEE